MRPSRLAPVALALALAAGPAPAAAAKPARAAKPAKGSPLSQLVARTVAAYGGIDAVTAVTGVRWEGRVQEGRFEGRFRRVLAPPARLRTEVRLVGAEPELLVLDGRRAWRDDTEVTGLAATQRAWLEAASLFVPALLVNERGTLVDRGTVKRHGKALRVIELPFEGGAALLAEIDPASGLVVSTRARVGTSEVVVEHGGFRRVDRVTFPFTATVRGAGEPRTFTTERIELVRAPEPSTFRP
jgi:hypothetical protein